tara:strand:- start:123 stop:353 length:231 start_codon:yes stop_codon:yes gene_type:complete
MGRAIDMEKDIDGLKLRVEKLENIVRGMTHTVSQREHIDLVEATKPKEADEKKKANDEGDGKSDVKPNRGNKKNKS